MFTPNDGRMVDFRSPTSPGPVCACGTGPVIGGRLPGLGVSLELVPLLKYSPNTGLLREEFVPDDSGIVVVVVVVIVSISLFGLVFLLFSPFDIAYEILEIRKRKGRRRIKYVVYIIVPKKALGVGITIQGDFADVITTQTK